MVTPTATEVVAEAEPAAVGDLIDFHAPAPPVVPPLPTSPAQRQGAFDQQEQREKERAARQQVAAACHRLLDLGWSWAWIAGRVGVAGRTLRHWWSHLFDRPGSACPLGRPRVRSSRKDRNAVIDLLDERGPAVGVPLLRHSFPVMSRAELSELKADYRRLWRERNREPLRVLDWPVPGRVWAIDYTGPLPLVDGQYPHLLTVRDLASGMQLLWRPLAAANGENAADALERLFAVHGAPLVLKSDNGGPFGCEAVQALLRGHGVEPLFSPPRWPRYNGAIEAGIGAMQERTDARAARAGHAGSWTIEDTAGALWEANALARPRGPSPSDRWAEHLPILPTERGLFRQSVERHLEDEKRAASSCIDDSADVWSKRAMARDAIRLALEECGYLHYTRRRILPPITGRKAASNM
jgi:transposase InsO family protein